LVELLGEIAAKIPINASISAPESTKASAQSGCARPTPAKGKIAAPVATAQARPRTMPPRA